MTDPDTGLDPDRVVVRDRRRLDPQTGAVRDVGAGPRATVQGAGPAPGPEVLPPLDGEPQQDVVDIVDVRVAELTADLQRISAEYANYRKRVDRDRVAVVEMATAGLLGELLPVLDDVDRAREHGDLTGAFQVVGERLEAVVGKAGLERYGAPGEPFDPAVHEALLQAEPDPAQSVATCAQVFQAGYRLAGGRVLRPARVSVAEAGASQAEVPSTSPAPVPAQD